MIDPAVAQSGFQCLPESHDFLMHGVAGRRLAALLHRFLVAVNAVVLHFAGCYF